MVLTTPVRALSATGVFWAPIRENNISCMQSMRGWDALASSAYSLGLSLNFGRSTRPGDEDGGVGGSTADMASAAREHFRVVLKDRRTEHIIATAESLAEAEADWRSVQDVLATISRTSVPETDSHLCKLALEKLSHLAADQASNASEARVHAAAWRPKEALMESSSLEASSSEWHMCAEVPLPDYAPVIADALSNDGLCSVSEPAQRTSSAGCMGSSGVLVDFGPIWFARVSPADRKMLVQIVCMVLYRVGRAEASDWGLFVARRYCRRCGFDLASILTDMELPWTDPLSGEESPPVASCAEGVTTEQNRLDTILQRVVPLFASHYASRAELMAAFHYVAIDLMVFATTDVDLQYAAGYDARMRVSVALRPCVCVLRR